MATIMLIVPRTTAPRNTVLEQEVPTFSIFFLEDGETITLNYSEQDKNKRFLI